MTKEIYDFEVSYTQCALTERIKQELATVPLNRRQYLSKIKKCKSNNLDKKYFDYDLGLDLSINPDSQVDVDRKLYDDKWYYYKAHHYLKIGVFQRKDVPVYKISLSHLSSEIINELYLFDLEERNYILKQSVAKIFEDINFKLYHDSVSSRLEVVLVK